MPKNKLYITLRESNQWARMMEVDHVGALNDIISHGKFNELILVQEALMEKKISNIAEAIRKARTEDLL